MNHEFLLKEYELCFKQLRFYDTRHGSILKFIFTLTSAVATAQFAIYKFLGTMTQGFYISHAFLSTIVFLATLLLYLAMLQNRLYFVFIARQLNAIRGFLMKTSTGDFQDNQLYTSVSFSAIKPSSVHTFQLFGAAFISALFAGSATYGICAAAGVTSYIVPVSLVFISVIALEIIGGVKYLKNMSKKNADISIHGEHDVVTSGARDLKHAHNKQ